MIRRMSLAATLILAAATLFVLVAVAGIEHTTQAWRPQPKPVEVVCVDVGLPYKLCYTVQR